MRELKVGDCSISFETKEGVKFGIETRRDLGISVRMNGKRILSMDAKGRNDLEAEQ